MISDTRHVTDVDPLRLTTLIVDDDEPVRSTLRRFLATLGHHALTASTGAEAIEAVEMHKVSCILLDVRLPDTSGLDLVPALLALEPFAAVIMLTAVNDASTAAICMQRGATDYQVKPIVLSELESSIERSLATRHERIKASDTQEWLQHELVQRGAELRRERASMERLSIASLEALVNALETKDSYLRGHSARVAELAAEVAAELGLSDVQVDQVRTAGQLHDIGKIGIRESVLSKKGPLTRDEFDHVKSHVTIGAQILAPLAHLREVIGFVRWHHERVDGSGYPDGLVGDQIPIGARILAACEVYDALTTTRPYQETMLPNEAVARMGDLVNTVIDAPVHYALRAVIARRTAANRPA